MFEFDWQSQKLWAAEKPVAPAQPSRLPRSRVARTMLVHWIEHCLECAPPQCYASCRLYVARADRKCARFVYGIRPNPAFGGLLDCGADLRFRRWGKMESTLRPRAAGLSEHRLWAGLDRIVTATVNVISAGLRPISPFRRLNGALALVRDNFFDRLAAGPGKADYDDFVVEAFSPDDQPFNLLLELWNGSSLAFRQAIPIRPGDNFFTMPAAPLISLVNWDNARLTLYPENDREARLIFTWLDFVKYRAPVPAAAKNLAPAGKVKCVAWDLDNTLWQGILVEDGADKLVLRPEAAELIGQLDERGILQTIASKNDFDPAWAVIQRHGLQDYFLHPAINWGAKSENLKQIAGRLNLGVDSIALIDDSAFERAEVEAALPMVRTYSEKQIAGLAGLPEFDVPVTEMSRVRRASYVTEIKRTEESHSFPGNYLDFLRSCRMRLQIFVPDDPSAVQRCLELVQRSNQLNLTSRRYSAVEFTGLLNTTGVLSLALRCEDRFGSYGIVGFASVDERETEPQLTNFVLSCRVAQKRVEHAFFQWLAQRERRRACRKLVADLVVTARNGPLAAVFDDLRFQKVSAKGDQVRLELPLETASGADDVVSLKVELPE